jgi:hypothetical protein
MSEELTEAIENEASELVESEQEKSIDVQVNSAETQARERGWVDLEEWKEQGKSEDEWVTYKHFNERGEWVDKHRKLQHKVKSFDERLSNNNKLWQATLDEKIRSLEEQKYQAVRLSDEDEVKNIDKQIDDAKTLKQSAQAEAQATIDKDDLAAEDQWAKKNETLLKGTGPKSVYANHAVQKYINQGYSGQELIKVVESEINKEFPDSNPNRNRSITDSSKPVASGKVSKVTSLSQLKGQDYSIAMSLKNNGMTEKQIVQMINDREK